MKGSAVEDKTARHYSFIRNIIFKNSTA